MPDIMLHYDSEYHYLFFLVADFIRKDGNKSNYYLMPNIMRKLLEVFLAFKLPYPTGVASKIETLADQGLKLDPARLRSLDRLVQLESHADSLDDVVTFSSMTIEETEAAATALSELIQELDKTHYDHLYKRCQFAPNAANKAA
jgi:wobble nucleotide-excising tRNase